MAQNSAHLTHTLQAKPSIFELVAADSLQATFHPALKRIAYVMILRFFTVCAWDFCVLLSICFI